jgi:translocation and assembly module TamB
VKRFRFVARIAAGLAALVAVVVLAVAVAFNSESFARWLVATIAERSDGALRVEAVEGSFGTGLMADLVEVELDSGSVTASSVNLQLDWRALVARSLILDSLHISRLDAEFTLDDSGSSSQSPAELSLLILIRELLIDELNVAYDESDFSIGDLSLELRLLRNHLELNAVSAQWEALELTGRSAFTLAEALAIDSAICIDGVFLDERVDVCVDAVGSSQALDVDAQLRMPFSAIGSGTVVPAADGEVQLDLTWRGAALNAIPNASSPEGSLRVSGTFDTPRIDATGSLVYDEQQADFELSAVRLAENVRLDALRLTMADSVAELSGNFANTFDNAQLALALRDFDPQQMIADMPGNIDLTAQLDLSMQPGLSVSAENIVARGSIRDYPLTAIGELAYSDATLLVEDLQIVSRSDQIRVRGEIGEALDLDVTASMTDIGILAADLSGDLAAEFRVTGTAARPYLRGAANLTQVRSASLEADSIRVTADAGIAPDDQIDLTLTADDVLLSGYSLGAITVNATGTGASHRIEFLSASGAATSRLIATGSLDDSDWRGRISQLELNPSGFGAWRMQTPADLSYGESGYAVSELCLRYELSGICASVNVTGSSDDALAVSAVNFDIGILAPFMPPELRAKGLVSANGSLTNFANDPRGSIAFEAQDAQVDVILAEEVLLPIPIREFELAALLDDAGATVSARIDAAETGNVAASLVVEDPNDEASAVRGSLSLEWHDAAALSLLSPDVDEVEGRLNAIMSIGGTLDSPALDGSVNWLDGALEVPAWGLVVEQIEASIDASQAREATFAATGVIDATPVELDGTVLLDAEQGWPMQLRLRGENLAIVQLADVEMRVSPDLQADVQLPNVRVTGAVTVPYARIRDVGLPQQAVVPSPDTVVHGLDDDEAARPLNLVADLTIELGDDVTYADTNLSASATGRLDLDYRSGQGAAAQGALRLAGEYDAYGNPLALERGQLIFVGPLDDPSLDILAVREIGEVTVGVQLTGTLSTPITSVFSDPAMSEADALSWLLFGRPLDGSREADSNALRSAALSMGLQQALPVIERIGDTLRLDDFAIRNTETDAGALMAGKYLSPNLYFRYTYGLFNRIGGLLLRYRINDRLSLETRSGEHNSMDLLYTLEKD